MPSAAEGHVLLPKDVSYWLETCDDDLTPRAPVTGDSVADIVIVGGGFSGLWTAYHLLREKPDLKISIVERQFCGFGASGRNGGWCSPRFPVETHALASRFGTEVARRTIEALEQTVRDIGEICEVEGIDAHYRNTGVLSIARSPSQIAGLKRSLDTYRSLGMEQGLHLLSAAETYDRVHVTQIQGGLWTEAGATVHPGRLVRGLARTVERLGATIFEQTAVTKIRRGQDARIVTPGGAIRARQAIVMAGEAYLTSLPQFRRTLLPMSSTIILSEPLSEAQWDEIGWQNGESLSSLVNIKNYLTRTADGRILYGSRGAPYAYASRISESAVRDERIFEWMRGCVREWWPVLENVHFSHAWGGYLGVPRDWMPTVSFDQQSRIGQLHGYTGRGVSTTALCAKLLAARILDRPSHLDDLPFHRSSAPQWEPEPLRWMGVRYVQNAFARIDEADAGGIGRPIDAKLAKSLGDQ